MMAKENMYNIFQMLHLQMIQLEYIKNSNTSDLTILQKAFVPDAEHGWSKKKLFVVGEFLILLFSIWLFLGAKGIRSNVKD